MTKRSALVLAPHFSPGYKAGGVLRSLVNFIDLFSDELYFDVITSDRDLGDENPYYKNDPYVKSGRDFTVFYCGKFSGYFSTLRKLLSSGHDFVFLNGLFNLRYCLMLLILKRLGLINSDFYLFIRGELFDSALKNKLILKRSILLFCRYCGLFSGVKFLVTDISESNALESLIGIKADYKVFPDLPSFSFYENLISRNLVKKEYCSEKLNLIYVGRVVEIKNLKYFISQLRNVYNNVNFEIFGVIDSSDYYKQCLLEVSKLPSNITVVFRGDCKHSDLPNVIYSADMLILPSLSENFGHVIAESLLLGVPVFATKNSPWNNFLADDFGLVMDIDSNISEVINQLKSIIDSRLIKSRTLDDRIEFSKAARSKMISFFKFDELKRSLL